MFGDVAIGERIELVPLQHDARRRAVATTHHELESKDRERYADPPGGSWPSGPPRLSRVVLQRGRGQTGIDRSSDSEATSQTFTRSPEIKLDGIFG